MRRIIFLLCMFNIACARPNNCGNGMTMECEKTYNPGLSMCLRDDLGSQSVWSNERGVINYLERTLDTGVCNLVESENGYLNYHLYKCDAGVQTKTFICSKHCNVETDKVNKVLHLSTNGKNFYVISVNNEITSGWFDNRKVIPIEKPKNKIHITCGKDSQQFVIDYKLHDECEIALGNYIPRLFLRPLCSNASLILSLLFFIICMYVVVLLTQYSQIRALIGTLFFIPVYLFEKLKLRIFGTCRSCGQTIHFFRRCKKTCGCGFIGESIDELRIHKERHCAGDSRLLLATEYAGTRFLKTVIAILLTVILLSLVTPISGEETEAYSEVMCKTWGICDQTSTQGPLIQLLNGLRKNMDDYKYVISNNDETEIRNKSQTEHQPMIEDDTSIYYMILIKDNRKLAIIPMEIIAILVSLHLINKTIKVYCASTMIKSFMKDIDKRIKTLQYNEFALKEAYNKTTYQITSKFLKEILGKTQSKLQVDLNLCKSCMMVHTKKPGKHGCCDCGWVDGDYVDPDNMHSITVNCLLNVTSISHTMQFMTMLKKAKVIFVILLSFMLLGTVTADCNSQDAGYVSDVVADYQQCVLDFLDLDITKCVLALRQEDSQVMVRCLGEPQVLNTVCKLMETRVIGECITNIAVLANEQKIIDAYQKNKTLADYYMEELKKSILNFFNNPWNLIEKMNTISGLMNRYAEHSIVYMLNEPTDYKDVDCHIVPPDHVIRSKLINALEIFKRLKSPMDSNDFLGWKGKDLLNTPIEFPNINDKGPIYNHRTATRTTDIPVIKSERTSERVDTSIELTTMSFADSNSIYNTGRKIMSYNEEELPGEKSVNIQGATTIIYSCKNTSDTFLSVGASNESYKISNDSLNGLHYFLDVSTDTLSYYMNTTTMKEVSKGNVSINKIPCDYTKYNLDSVIAFGPENCPTDFVLYSTNEDRGAHYVIMKGSNGHLYYCIEGKDKDFKVYGYKQVGCFIYFDTSEGLLHDIERCYHLESPHTRSFSERETIRDKHLNRAIDEMTWKQYVDKYLEPIELDVKNGKAKVINAIKSIYKAEKTITIKGITTSKGIEGASVVFDLNLDQYESVKYTVLDKLGRELFDISLSVESARLSNEYVHSYKAPISKGIDVRSTSNCTGVCGSFKPRYNAIGYSFGKTSTWGCEEFSCWAIGTGCTWGDCKEIEDRKNGYDIYKRAADTDEKVANICVYLLKKGFCVDLTKNDKKIIGEFDFQAKMADTSILPELIALDSRETVRFGQINQRGEYGLDCGNYQVVNETVFGVPAPDIHVHCNGIAPKTVSAKSCWKNDNQLCHNLEELDRERFNVKRVGNSKIVISREHTQIGTATIAFDIGSLSIESNEILSQTRFHPGHCSGCYDCNLGVFCDLNIETTTRGSCKMNCTCPASHDGLIVSPEESLVHLHLVCGEKFRKIQCTICGKTVDFVAELREDKSLLSVNTPHERTEIESFDNKYNSWWTEAARELGKYFSAFNIFGYFSTIKVVFYVIIGLFIIYILSIFVIPITKVLYKMVHTTYKNVIKVSDKHQRLELQERVSLANPRRIIKIGRND